MPLSQATIDFARQHDEDDVRKLALRRPPEGVDLTAALRQIAGRQAARRKLPAWASRDNIMYPAHLSMEQCSSEATARYKATLAAGFAGSAEAMTDLTGGLGVDFYFLQEHFAKATYIERDETLCELAAHNLGELGVGADVLNADAVEALDALPHQNLIFIDPARRSASGSKVFRLADCQPDVSALHDRLLAKADTVMIKLSPMLDIHEALRGLPATKQVHVVEHDGECKELVVVLNGTGGAAASGAGQAAAGSPTIICTDTSWRFEFTYEEESRAAVTFAQSVGAYLYEPSPALMKAGAFRTIAARYNLQKLHTDTHLYTSDTLAPDFPGRKQEVLAAVTVREFRQLHLERANIVCRNFPQPPATLRQRLKLKDGGTDFIYAVTLSSGQHALIHTRPVSNSKASQ